MIIRDNDQPQATTDEVADCRAVDVGVSGFAECLCTGPNSCAYALAFGYAFLCQHPRMGEIIANTEKRKPGVVNAN